jgi:Icc-related predicted phosphoesterase
MRVCLFASDLHGRTERYEKLFRLIEDEAPSAVALGGDLLPISPLAEGFIAEYLRRRLHELSSRLKESYPRLLLILGNDDLRSEEAEVLAGEREGLWAYLHNRRLELLGRIFFGYACIPPSPFLLKDWERYDVSRHVDVGCLSPEEGWRSVPADREVSSATIQHDLEQLAGSENLEGSLFLFHAPPYRTSLDQAALHRRRVDHAPVDPHIGSIAVRRFIERRQPLVTLHGHVHESSRLSGSWRDRLGRTHCYSAAWDGPELAVIRFDLERPGEAERLLL